MTAAQDILVAVKSVMLALKFRGADLEVADILRTLKLDGYPVATRNAKSDVMTTPAVRNAIEFMCLLNWPRSRDSEGAF